MPRAVELVSRRPPTAGLPEGKNSIVGYSYDPWPGVPPQDSKEAVRWYRMAADPGAHDRRTIQSGLDGYDWYGRSRKTMSRRVALVPEGADQGVAPPAKAEARRNSTPGRR